MPSVASLLDHQFFCFPTHEARQAMNLCLQIIVDTFIEPMLGWCTSHYNHPECELHGSDLVGLLEDGSPVIGAVLPLHSSKYLYRAKIQFTKPPSPHEPCTMFRMEIFEQYLAMRFAIEGINISPDLLPNLTLGFQVYDSCLGFHQDLEATFRLLTGQNPAVPNYFCQKSPPVFCMIGSSISTHSILNAHILGLYRYPQVPVSVCTESCPAGFRKMLRRDMPVCCFQCVPCPLGEILNWTDSTDCVKCPLDKWPNAQRDRCLPKNREFLSFEEPLGAALAAMSILSSVIPVSIGGLFIRYKNTPIVRANNFSLSCLLLMSMSLCFLCSLSFIGYPQSKKCLLQQVAFGMVFTICVSCILAKTIMVVFAFLATKPGSSFKRLARPLASYIVISISTFLQFILCISWISLAPPYPEDNIETHPGLIITECNEGTPIAFWCMLGYLGLLAAISFIVAFTARRLPDSFNEAKFITFSMLAFLSVWLSYIPASLSAHGKYTVAMEVFAILSSSWAIVICMFAPKCFVLLFRPHTNSREHLMGRFKSSN
ncbi:vomeronasal type-2 receptor 26-like [Pelodytes ibericus]